MTNMLSNDTRERFARIRELRKQLNKEINGLTGCLMSDTNNAVAACTANYEEVQLYDQDRMGAERAKRLLRDIADGNTVVVRWHDENAKRVCYGFHVEGVASCMVVNCMDGEVI